MKATQKSDIHVPKSRGRDKRTRSERVRDLAWAYSAIDEAEFFGIMLSESVRKTILRQRRGEFGPGSRLLASLKDTLPMSYQLYRSDIWTLTDPDQIGILDLKPVLERLGYRFWLAFEPEYIEGSKLFSMRYDRLGNVLTKLRSIHKDIDENYSELSKSGLAVSQLALAALDYSCAVLCIIHMLARTCQIQNFSNAPELLESAYSKLDFGHVFLLFDPPRFISKLKFGIGYTELELDADDRARAAFEREYSNAAVINAYFKDFARLIYSEIEFLTAQKTIVTGK